MQLSHEEFDLSIALATSLASLLLFRSPGVGYLQHLPRFDGDRDTARICFLRSGLHAQNHLHTKSLLSLELQCIRTFSPTANKSILG